jgi:hypothetical protein
MTFADPHADLARKPRVSQLGIWSLSFAPVPFVLEHLLPPMGAVESTGVPPWIASIVTTVAFFGIVTFPFIVLFAVIISLVAAVFAPGWWRLAGALSLLLLGLQIVWLFNWLGTLKGD